LKGWSEKLVKKLTTELKKYVSEENFEYAITRRDQIARLKQ